MGAADTEIEGPRVQGFKGPRVEAPGARPVAISSLQLNAINTPRTPGPGITYSESSMPALTDKYFRRCLTDQTGAGVRDQKHGFNTG